MEGYPGGRVRPDTGQPFRRLGESLDHATDSGRYEAGDLANPARWHRRQFLGGTWWNWRVPMTKGLRRTDQGTQNLLNKGLEIG